MADDVFWQDGDQLSEGNLGKALLAENNKDYVDRGGGITGPTNGDITVEAAQAFIEDTASEQLYKVYPSSETLSLPNATGDNYLYITFDPATQDSATYEITATQGNVSNPVALLRAVVDGGAGTYETRNDAPVGTFESVNTERITNGPIYAGNQDAGDVDARLDATLSKATDGDTVELEPDVTHTDSRTISKNLLLESSGVSAAALFDSAVTFDSEIKTQGVRFNGDVTVNADLTEITAARMGGAASFTVSANNFIFTNNSFGSVTFESGTSGGVVDSCTQTTVADNGTNTVGDIA